MKRKIILIAGVATSLFIVSCSSTPKEVAKEEISIPEEMTVEEAKIAVETIKLEQTHGAFTTESLSLNSSKEYSFEVTNHAGRPAAFVLVPSDKMVEGATQEDIMAAAVADAMLEGALQDGETGTSKKPVTLEKGEYVYFCPMNETPQYKIIVE